MDEFSYIHMNFDGEPDPTPWTTMIEIQADTKPWMERVGDEVHIHVTALRLSVDGVGNKHPATMVLPVSGLTERIADILAMTMGIQIPDEWIP